MLDNVESLETNSLLQPLWLTFVLFFKAAGDFTRHLPDRIKWSSVLYLSFTSELLEYTVFCVQTSLVHCVLCTDLPGSLCSVYRPPWFTVFCVQTSLVHCVLCTDLPGSLCSMYRPPWFTVFCVQTSLVHCVLCTDLPWFTVFCVQTSPGSLCSVYRPPLVHCVLCTDLPGTQCSVLSLRCDPL